MDDETTALPESQPTFSAPEQDESLRRQLLQELDRLIERVRSIAPDYVPPPFSPQNLVELVERNLRRFSPQISLGILSKLRSSLVEDLFDIDTWKGIWYMLNYSLDYQSDLLRRRLTGEYETDEWGYDAELLQAILPFFNFFFYLLAGGNERVRKCT